MHSAHCHLKEYDQAIECLNEMSDIEEYLNSEKIIPIPLNKKDFQSYINALEKLKNPNAKKTLINLAQTELEKFERGEKTQKKAYETIEKNTPLIKDEKDQQFIVRLNKDSNIPDMIEEFNRNAKNNTENNLKEFVEKIGGKYSIQNPSIHIDFYLIRITDETTEGMCKPVSQVEYNEHVGEKHQRTLTTHKPHGSRNGKKYIIDLTFQKDLVNLSQEIFGIKKAFEFED